MLNPKCHKTLTKTLVNRSSPSNQGTYQLDFPNFSPLRSGLTTSEHKEMVWEGKGWTTHPSERKPHKSKEQGHLAWEKPQRPTQCLGPQRHGQRLDTTETRMHDPSRRGTKGSTPIMDKRNHMIPQEEAQRAQHQSCDNRKHNSTVGSSKRGNGAQHHRHKSTKLTSSPLNTWTSAKEHTKLTLNSWHREKETTKAQLRQTKETHQSSPYANASSPWTCGCKLPNFSSPLLNLH
jgi:hypothetical protein